MRSILGLTLALILSACGSEPPSLATTDAAADKHLNAKIKFNPHTKYAIEHKERVKIEENNNGIYNVWYKYKITSNYDFVGHTHEKSKEYYQKLNADGLVSLAGSAGKEFSPGMMFELLGGVLGNNSMSGAVALAIEAEKILQNINSSDNLQTKAFNAAFRRCGVSCKDAIENFQGNPFEKLVNNYAYILAIDYMAKNHLNAPETDAYPVDVQFQVESDS